MNEQQYEMLKQTQGNVAGGMQKANMAPSGNEAYYRDIPMDKLNEATNVDHPIPYLEMGSSFLIGLAVGFFIKKSFKAVLFILGLSLIIMFYMESQGIFKINDQVLQESISQGADYFNFLVASVKERITTFQSGVGALAGFVVGLKMG